MKVLWICNLMLPMIAESFQMEASNKEGWLSGLADVLLQNQGKNGIDLAIAFPAPERLLPPGEDVFQRELTVRGAKLKCYGFREDTVNPHRYDQGLEGRIKKIMEDYQPRLVHCFGTEYPHTLATCRTFPDKKRLLITIQGLCSVCADVYYANLPKKVVRGVTFRDFIKKDDLARQREKFLKRGEMEREAVRLAGNVGGRTAWDRYYASLWNPDARYFEMKETLRSDFYEGQWKRENCEPHSIFLSQGDYPIKGFHYMLLAMPEILKKYPDAHLYVAGNSIIAHGTWKEKLKLSSYGKYLRSLIQKHDLEGKVTVLGSLNGKQMKEQYLKSHLFVCPSVIENSPNSLGEAMLLGMPCVSADVGGIPSIFTGGRDGLTYEGYRSRENASDEEDQLLQIAGNLSQAVLRIWSDAAKEAYYCQNARAHALRNYNQKENYEKTVETYSAMAGD